MHHKYHAEPYWEIPLRILEFYQLVSSHEPPLLPDDYILGNVAHEGYCCYFPLSLLSIGNP